MALTSSNSSDSDEYDLWLMVNYVLLILGNVIIFDDAVKPLMRLMLGNENVADISDKSNASAYSFIPNYTSLN